MHCSCGGVGPFANKQRMIKVQWGSGGEATVEASCSGQLYTGDIMDVQKLF